MCPEGDHLNFWYHLQSCVKREHVLSDNHTDRSKIYISPSASHHCECSFIILVFLTPCFKIASAIKTQHFKYKNYFIQI